MLVVSHCHEWSIDTSLHWMAMLVLEHSKFSYVASLTREHCSLLWILIASYFCLLHHSYFALYPLRLKPFPQHGENGPLKPLVFITALAVNLYAALRPSCEEVALLHIQPWLETTCQWRGRTASRLNRCWLSVTVHHTTTTTLCVHFN